MMSARDHAEAITLWRAICKEVGVCVPFVRVVLMALENLLSEIRGEREALRGEAALDARPSVLGNDTDPNAFAEPSTEHRAPSTERCPTTGAHAAGRAAELMEVELHITPELFGSLPRLAEGVIGYMAEHDGALYIPVIYSTEPGQGNVARYLDALRRDRRVVVPCVLSSKLAGMLARRGFVERWESAEEFGEHVPCWVREPQC